MQQSVTLPNDLSKLAPAGVKTYVLDTNVLLHDPTAITAFAEHRVVIPMTVLEELDHIKDRRDKSVSREARIAIQMIDKVVGSAAPQAIQAGVDIPGSTLSETSVGLRFSRTSYSTQMTTCRFWIARRTRRMTIASSTSPSNTRANTLTSLYVW